MKLYNVGLNSNVVSVYDKTKTTILGRAFQKTLNSQVVIGPPLTKFIDVQTDTGVAPGGPMHLSINGRLFIITAVSGGLATLVLYNFSTVTGAYSFVGKLVVTLPNFAATTHTLRGFKVFDTGTTGWKIFIGTTASILPNGGVFMVNALALTDFVPTGFATIPMATATSQKGVYFLQDPSAAGASYVATSLAGLVLPSLSANAAINTKIFAHNGVSATHQYYSYDWGTAPQVAGTQTGATITVGAPGVVTTGSAHGFSALDQITFTAGVVPTGLSLNTTYFVVAAGLTSTQFSVSATSGGAAITTTVTAGSGVTVMRSLGICTNIFSMKTGNLPALTGTLLNANAEYYAVPSHTANAGSDCVFSTTTTNLYLGKISDLTSGATTWPNLVSSNVIGSGIDVTAPIPVFATYSNECDMALYATNTASFIAKKVLNSQISLTFGGLSNAWLETLNPVTVPFSLASIVGLESRSGWLLAVGSTVGQRGILAMDLQSDASFSYSQVISPVINAPSSQLKIVDALEQLFDYTDSLTFQYKTAATAGDATFNSSSTGWTTISTAVDLSTFSTQAYIQFRILFQIADLLANTPAQVQDLCYVLSQIAEMSDNWQGSSANTSSSGASPFKIAFRLTKAYLSGTVPRLYLRGYDDSNNVVFQVDTVTNPTTFQYTANNGTSFSALGTIPNTPLTTELQASWGTPNGLINTWSLSET